MSQAMWKDAYGPLDGSQITDLIVDTTISAYKGVWYFVVVFESGWKYE